MTAATADISRIGFSSDLFEQFLASRTEPEWVTQKRRAAFQLYQELLTTDLDPEEFKRVDLRIFNAARFRPTAAPTDPSAVAALLCDRAEFGGAIVHRDGHADAAVLSPQLQAQGVLFGSLGDFLQSHRELLESRFLQQAVRPEADRFAAWHAAFWTSGTLLYVPRNVEVTLPLHSLIAHTRDGVADFTHTLIILEDGARATLLEETASASAETAGLHVGCVELIVGRDAVLRYVQLQNWNEKSWHFAHQAGCVAAGGSLQWTAAGLGSRLAHIHQDVNLEGRSATAEVNGVTFAGNRQKISWYTQQHHRQQGTRSDLLYKQVLRDDARVVWRGMIKVDPAAQQTDGYQRSDALMLSEDARCDSIPGLEIEADDVRCTHGATTGQVDREQIFYCMSRGISRKEAMHMIVEGFFRQVYDRIPIEIVRETLSRTVQSKLGIETVVL
jgi:Fe-S cluster assembly protein SufD